GPRALQNPLHVGPQLRLPPIVAGRLLGTRRLACARGLEQRLGSRGVESGVVTRWEAIVPPGPRLTRILLHERPRHRMVSRGDEDRKSTRLNSSHEWISYAVFCLKKKKNR